MDIKNDFLYSIIIPVYNVQKYIKTCVESIQKQTDTRWEIILVDDGSTDESGKICDDLAKNDKRIHVKHQSNYGLSVARNTGMLLAKGEYIAFLDSDDYWKNINALSEIRELIALKSHPELILIGYEKYNLSTGKRKGFPALSIPKDEIFLKKKFLLEKRKYCNSACTKIIQRSFLLNHNLIFPEGMKSEDLIWSCKVLIKTKSIECYPEIVMTYQIGRPGSISNSFSEKNFEDIVQQFDESIKWLEENTLEEQMLIKSYWAEQLCWFMSFFPIVNNGNLDKTLQETMILYDLLPYGLCLRAKIVNFLCAFIGRKATIKLLYYYRIKKIL